jgi:hypothetical protein
MDFYLFTLEILPLMPPIGQKTIISWSSLLGLLIPIGIVLELVFSAPPIFVLIGALNMTASIFGLGYFVMKSDKVISS